MFLERYTLTQEEIENLNRPKTSKQIDLGIKKFPPRKAQHQINGFTGEFYQSFSEELALILLQSLLKKWMRKETGILIHY